MAINWSKLAEGALSSLTGGLLNLGTSVIGGSVMSNISNKQLRQNMVYQNNWQAQQAEIARDWQADQAQVQNEWSEKMNTQQQEWQEGMWNKTNEWNSEGARMQRLLDAGVNPNNAAGLVSGNNTAAQLAQQPQIPSANPYPSTSVPNGGSMQGVSLIDGVNAMNNAKLVQAQTDLIEAQAEGQRRENEWITPLRQADIKRFSAQTQDYIAHAKLQDAQREQITDVLTPYYQSLEGLNREEANKVIQETKNLVQEYKNLQAQEDETRKNIQLKQKQIEELQAQIGALHAQAEKDRAQAALTKAETELTELKKVGQKIQNGIEALRFSTYKGTGVDPNNSSPIGSFATAINRWFDDVKNKLHEWDVEMTQTFLGALDTLLENMANQYTPPSLPQNQAGGYQYRSGSYYSPIH